jgi:MtrB/PioB family decaheme-associated outer membrane protein
MDLVRSRVRSALTGALLSVATAARAQLPPPAAGSIAVAGELGPRSYLTRPDSLSIGKFEEYRDPGAAHKSSALLEQLFVRFTPADTFSVYSFSARNLLYRDQSAWLLAKKPGAYDFQVRWDRIPHTYSTTARSPGNEFGTPGFNTLPAIRPDSNAWRNAPYIGPIRNQVDPIKASLALTPNQYIDFKADYTHISKNGGMPRSISFSGSSGPQREYVSPIDQSINDARISQGFTSGDRPPGGALSFIKSYQANLSYAYSRFDNAIRSTMVDNPQLSVSSFASGTATARVSLEPSNFSQTAGANGSMLLPLRTQIMAAITTSWARQDDRFFPQTSNDSLARDPNYNLVSRYSRASLDGRMRTSTYMLSATTHPISGLTVVARYRSFDLSNQTPAFSIPAMIVSDRTVTLADSEKFEAHPYTKTNTNLSSTYLVVPGLALSAGFGLEEWKRDTAVRNIAETIERMPRASVDFTKFDWFTLRTSYLYASRRGNTPYTESVTEITGFRRFDEANRNRTRVSMSGTVTPIDLVTIGLMVEAGTDKYPNSLYGVQRDISLAKGLDVDVSPASWLSASAGWLREDVKDSANYLYRTGAVGSATYNNPTYTWMNTNKDKNTTWYANLTATIIPDKIELVGSWSLIDSHWQMFNANPTTPTGGTAAQNLAATAQDWPEVSQRLQPLALEFRYRYASDWSMALRVQAERYAQTDFRTVAPVFTTTGLNNAPVLPVGWGPGDLPGTIGQVTGAATGQYHFLGDNYRPYTASSVTLLLSYHPSLMPFVKPRSTF